MTADISTLPVPAPAPLSAEEFDALVARLATPIAEFAPPSYISGEGGYFDKIRDMDAAASQDIGNVEAATEAGLVASNRRVHERLDAYLRVEHAEIAAAEAPAEPVAEPVLDDAPDEPVHEPALDMAAAPVPGDDEHMAKFLAAHDAEDARVEAGQTAILPAAESGEAAPE